MSKQLHVVETLNEARNSLIHTLVDVYCIDKQVTNVDAAALHLIAESLPSSSFLYFSAEETAALASCFEELTKNELLNLNDSEGLRLFIMSLPESTQRIVKTYFGVVQRCIGLSEDVLAATALLLTNSDYRTFLYSELSHIFKQ